MPSILALAKKLLTPVAYKVVLRIKFHRLVLSKENRALNNYGFYLKLKNYRILMSWFDGVLGGPERFLAPVNSLVTNHFIAVNRQAYDDVLGVTCNRFNKESVIN